MYNGRKRFQSILSRLPTPLEKGTPTLVCGAWWNLRYFYMWMCPQVPISDKYPSSCSMYLSFPFCPTSRIIHLHHNYIKTHTFIQTPKKRVSITLIPYLALRDKTRLMKPACTYCMFPLLSWNVMEEYKTLQASIWNAQLMLRSHISRHGIWVSKSCRLHNTFIARYSFEGAIIREYCHSKVNVVTTYKGLLLSVSSSSIFPKRWIVESCQMDSRTIWRACEANHGVCSGVENIISGSSSITHETPSRRTGGHTLQAILGMRRYTCVKSHDTWVR